MTRATPGWLRWCFCPFKGRNKPQWKQDANSDYPKPCTPGERAITQLEQWDILRRLRYCHSRADQIPRAVLVLQLREAG